MAGETRWTPGPWRVREHPRNPDQFFVEAPRLDPSHAYDIEIMGDDTTLYPTKRADAHLISAAPDLASVGQQLLAAMDRGDLVCRDAALRFSLETALAKARGEHP